MTVWIRPEIMHLLPQAAVIYDLDGVLVDVRATYRRAYLQGLHWHLTGDLHLPLVGPPASLRAVHLLKQHKGFNDPAEVVAILLRLALVAAFARPHSPLDRGHIAAEAWIAAALRDDRLSDWRTHTFAGLNPAILQQIQALEDPARALQLSREAYVGSAHVGEVFGTQPLRRVRGLYRHDKPLADRTLDPGPRPVAVYTGRTVAEGRLVTGQFARFAGRPVPVEAVDTGAHKPDGAPLERLRQQLQVDTVLYIGDLQADRQALLDARARFGHARWLLGQVLATPRTPRWSEADLASDRVDALIAALGTYAV